MKINFIMIGLFLFAINLFAQPTTISYQGILTDDEGNPLEGTKTLSFAIYQQETNGTSIWNEVHINVNVDEGLFNVELGSVSPFGTLNFSQELWLEISVDGSKLTPRILFNANSYSINTKIASNLAGGAAGSIPFQIGEDNTSMLSVGNEGEVLSIVNGLPQWAIPPSAPVTSVAGKTGIVSLVKGDVGLGNVDNTSDENKPISTATQTALDGKVDEVTGKGLSTEDYTSAEKTKLAGIAENANNYSHPTGDGNLHVPATGTTNDGKVLTAGATEGSLTWETPYTGLTNFTETNFTYDSRSGVKFIPNNESADVDLVLQAKRYGAIIAQQPDGTNTGGNKRGYLATDLQRFRTNATKVASGNYATIVGGSNNTASGENSTAMRSGVIASGIVSTAIGSGTIASGHSSTAMGSGTTASGNYSTAIGRYTTAPSYYETALGSYNTNYTPVYSDDWDDTDRLFVVGNGTFAGSRSNALTILKNANTTIGGSLTLNGNGTNASITFPTSRGTSGQVLQTDGNGSTSWGTAASQWVTSGANIYFSTGNVGIGTSTTNAQFQLSNSIINRKIVMYQIDDNDHQFYGLGINTNTLRYQVLSNSDSHVFYAGSSSSSSNELFRIKGTGEVLIPALSTAGVLLNDAAGTISSSAGTSGQVLTTNGSGGVVWANAGTGTVTSVSGTAPIVSSGGTTPDISISPASISTAGSMSASDKSKLDGIAANANNYTHPTGDGNLHIPATGTSNNGKVLTAGATAGSISWETPTSGSITSVTGTAPISVATGSTTPVISIDAATTTAAGSMSASDKTKLDGLVGSQWSTSGTNIYYNSGNVGIGTSTINAQLQLSNSVVNRKIVLWQNTNNDHNFYGLGINSNTLRYQLPGTTDSHVFYAGTSSTASDELFRIMGSGEVLIPALTTAGVLLNDASGLISSSVGNSGQVLSTSGNGGISWTTPYTGLTNFTESNYTYDTKIGVKFTPNNSADDVDLVLQPKGTGAIIAQQPGGTSTGGNKRGIKAVDLQTGRINAGQVASGDYATLIGGKGNIASGNYSVAMGLGTIASGENSTSMGSATTASGRNSTSLGEGSTASGNTSTAMGEVTTASGDFSTALGYNTTAPSGFETVAGSYNTAYTPSSATAWVATDRLFVIGNGTITTASNALTILKNANTTIGGSLTVNGNGTDVSITFPATRGTIGQVLSTSGSGGLGWITPTNGTVTNVSGTTPISVATGTSTPVISIAAATTSSAGSMSAADKTKLDGINGTETKVTAGTNVSVSGTGTTSNPYVINTKAHTIGESYGGGIVFWVDDTGQHGLIAATDDQSTAMQWSNGIDKLTGTKGDGLFAGEMNSVIIVSLQLPDNDTGVFAANVCLDYSVTVDGITYGDWYLPSLYELALLYQEKDNIGGFSNAKYWSSTEYGKFIAYTFNFQTGVQSGKNKVDQDGRVRAIRRF